MLWEKVKFSEGPRLTGRIETILPNGKAGFIKTPEGGSHYFRLQSFQGRRDTATVGTEVSFYLEDGFDAKKNRPSQVAVHVAPNRELKTGSKGT